MNNKICRDYFWTCVGDSFACKLRCNLDYNLNSFTSKLFEINSIYSKSEFEKILYEKLMRLP